MKRLIIKIKYNFYDWLYNKLKKYYPPINTPYISGKFSDTTSVINPKIYKIYLLYDKYKWLCIEEHFNTFESMYKKGFPQRPTMSVNIKPNQSTLERL